MKQPQKRCSLRRKVKGIVRSIKESCEHLFQLGQMPMPDDAQMILERTAVLTHLNILFREVLGTQLAQMVANHLRRCARQESGWIARALRVAARRIQMPYVPITSIPT